MNLTEARELAEDKFEAIDCPLCGSNSYKLFCLGGDKMFGHPGRFQVVRCEECGLYYLNPRPRREFIREFYMYYDEANAGFWNEYQLGYLDERSSPAQRKADQRVDAILRYRVLDSSARMLDVGCGLGGFLYYASRRVEAQVFGLDFDPQAVGFATTSLGMAGVYVGELAHSPWPEAYFDVITMWHYLEHSYTPHKDLRCARRLLKSGGVLAVGVPNINALSARLFKANWAGLQPPLHLLHFSETTLTNLLAQYHFAPLHVHYHTDIKPTTLSLLFLLGASDLSSFIQPGRRWFSYLLALGLSPLTVPLSLVAKLVRASSTFDFYARKLP